MNFSKENILEYYLIIFASLFLIISIIIGVEIENILLNIGLIIYGFILILLSKRFSFKSLKIIFLIPAIFAVYSNVKPIISELHQTDMDSVLIQIDHHLIGMRAPELFEIIQSPLITEYFQISYFSFFLLPIFGYILFKIERDNTNSQLFLRNVLFGFLFSYFLYLFIPAIGPRFTLYRFESISSELPGLYFTELIRELINYGGGITNSEINPNFQVNRDCMPSGHTMITVILLIISLKIKSNWKILIFIFGISLILSTIYLRYHYLIDLIAGFILAFTSIWLESRIYQFLMSKND